MTSSTVALCPFGTQLRNNTSPDGGRFTVLKAYNDHNAQQIVADYNQSESANHYREFSSDPNPNEGVLLCVSSLACAFATLILNFFLVNFPSNDMGRNVNGASYSRFTGSDLKALAVAFSFLDDTSTSLCVSRAGFLIDTLYF